VQTVAVLLISVGRRRRCSYLKEKGQWAGIPMAWWQYALLGAAGGVLVEALAVFKWITIWQNNRRTRTGMIRAKPPSWRQYIDVPAAIWLLAIRTPLGAGAATLFGMTGQIRGAYAAMAFGFAAPAILAQLGSVPQIAAAIKQDDTPANLLLPAEKGSSQRGEVE
jgi:hypothetical protein